MAAKTLAVVAVGALLSAGWVSGTPPAKADATQDQKFYHLMIRTDTDHPVVITNFPLAREKGIGACRMEDNGSTPFQALKAVEGTGESFDVANSITSAAETIYCPWHEANLNSPTWVNSSTPLSIPFEYPPMEWSP